MQSYVRSVEAEQDKHPILVEAGIGVAGHLEVIGSLCFPRRGRQYSGSHHRQIVLRLFWIAHYVFVYFTRPGLGRHSVSPLAASCFRLPHPRSWDQRIRTVSNERVVGYSSLCGFFAARIHTFVPQDNRVIPEKLSNP